MAETTITGLPNATTPLSGAERVPMDQDGQTVDAPVSAIAALAPGTDLAYTAATRTLASSTGADVVLPLATTTAPGLAPTLPGGTSTFLRSDGTFATPPGGATDLSYDPATGLLSSSTGTDVTLPLADGTNPGLLSAAGFSKLSSIMVDEARLVVVPVRNNSGAPITKGTPVYVTGSSGTRITIAPADASVEATAAGTLGLVYASISNNADGLVLAVGQLDGISTAGLTEGAIAWLSETTGQITTTRPVAPAHGVALGYVVKTGSGTSGILYVKVDNGLELDELHDVLTVNPQTRQVLYRNAAGLWVNQSLAAADISDSTALGRSLLTVADAAAARSAIGAEQAGAAAAAVSAHQSSVTPVHSAAQITGLGTAATLNVPATGDAISTQVVKGDDSRLGDSREWSASTISQAEAEAGVSTTRRAWNALRVRQAIEAWWAAYSSAIGQALATAANAGAARSAISAEQAGAAATAQAFAIQRANHTGTQAASTITGLAAVATTGAYGDLSGRPTLFDPASPGAIGGTTPAAGTFTGLLLPAQGSAPAAPATGLRLYAGSGNALSWIGANGFVRVFDGTAITADRTYTLPNASGIVGLLSSAAPANLAATAAAGTATDAARADHVHARPTLGELGAASTAAFTSSTAGLVPPSGGGTTNFLRADGTFAEPPGRGGSGTKTIQRFTAMDNQPPASNFATLDTRNSVAVLEFDAATEESAVFVGAISEGANLTSGLLVRIWWGADTATGGNVRWGAQFEKSGTDLDGDSFDTLTEVTSAASGTSGIEVVAEITCTAIDSLAAGDGFRLKVTRKAADATNDTMTGDAQLVRIEVRGVA